MTAFWPAGSNHPRPRPGKRSPRLVCAVALGGLFIGLLASSPSHAGQVSSSAQRASAAPAIDARVGNLTTRDPGFPATTVPARQLQSATVRQNLVAKRLTGTFVLRGVPTAANNAALVVAFGFKNSNGACTDDLLQSTSTLNPGAGFARSGRTITMNRAVSEAGYETWDCAIVGIFNPGPAEPLHDVLTGNLRNVPAKPKLRIQRVSLLGATAKPVKLVRGVWTTLEVTVVNNGRVPAPNVRVRGAGKGVRVQTAKLGTLNRGGGKTTTRVRVRLNATGKRSVRLVAVGGGAQTALRFPVRSVPAPARPRAGRYVGGGGKITFRVRKARMIQFKAKRVRMTCAPYGGFPTYRTVNLNFPAKPIPRNGIVDAVKNWRKGSAWYTARLRFRIAKGAVRKGTFSYVTAGSCRVKESFTARRVGD